MPRHRQLRDAINEIYVAGCAGNNFITLKSLLNAFKQLAKEHLRHEDSVSRKINSGPLPAVADRLAFLKAMVDASIEEHIDSHTQSMAQLNEIIRDAHFEPGSVDKAFSLSLKTWFSDHCVTHDAHLKPVFQALSNGKA